ncbi:hypothetical protein EUGRSUZ_C02618 [Eucalyptus grandis]|uniref:TIR domain-containing protein n=2 Tax=Eucalyptus grandis TaxID=71139 RepID=A0A059CS92_EUCGR|nr:hypothetical protein EUGRSUZ_C02618 [Eucalyptus grandis]
MAPEDVAAGRKRKCPESSSLLSCGINYEVFLSFRGEDTRTTITDHLHSRLTKAGIKVFRDDEGLRAGEEIHPKLIDTIKRSTISIAVFSKDYASSRSCLMEVVQMWECRKLNGQIIIPIFYDVSPNDVKRQAGDFGRSFEKHVQNGVNADTIQRWKDVFRNIGGLSGFNRENINGGHESQLVDKVFTRVWQVLKKDDQLVTDKLVGVDLHVQAMMTKLGAVHSQGKATRVCGEDVRVIGICGMPGVGKTTLARVVFNKLHEFFDECSFLEDINSKPIKDSQTFLIADLQKEKPESLRSSGHGIKIISSRFKQMKVLIVLDDVRMSEQIEALAGKFSWFGPGSRIIVTTNKRNFIKHFDFGEEDKDREAEEYEVSRLGDHHALQLFCKHAFRGAAFPDDPKYVSHSRDIVEALGGHPMAIVLRAGYLKKTKNIDIWSSTRDSLRDHPDERKVEAAFRASYDSLNPGTQEIFLDIACFFIGKDQRIPSYMWKACGCCPPAEIEDLCDMHLLEIGKNNELRMHDLVRDFGRKLVKDKGRCKRCRYWNQSVALPGAEDFQGTISVKGIGLTVEKGCPDSFECERFWKMSNLIYLRLDQAKIQGDITKLPSSLRWLDWRECHSIPELGNMHLKELVILDLSWSPVTKDSEFWKKITEKVEELKVLNLQGCDKLHASLNFQAPIKLEILILEDCTQLSQIGTFIRGLENLSSLNLRNCRRVKKLPPELAQMKSLKELLIDGTGIDIIYIQKGSLQGLKKLSACGCEELKDISTISCLDSLTSLALDGAKEVRVPKTFEFPQKLQRLSLRECRRFNKLPPSIEKLGLLEVMDLSFTGISELPESVKGLRNLKTLKMEHTHLQKFPEYIVELGKLEEIDFSGCISLGGQVCCDISVLSCLRILRLKSSNVAELPQGICDHSRLQILDILKCNQLKELPALPPSLLSLRWGSRDMAVPDLSYLTNLKELRLKSGSSSQTPNVEWIARLPSLETLQLSVSKVTNLPGNFSALTQLRELSLSYMKELDLTQLPSSSLLTLRLKYCKIPEPTFSSLQHHLSELELKHCELAEIDGLKNFKSLVVLKISYCEGVTNLNGLEELPRLRKVKGIFEDGPRLPKLSERVELDICPAV